MKGRTIAVLAAAVVTAAACAKNEKTTADTSTIHATDTANGEVKPTTDTIIKSTTTTVDTINGKPADTTKAIATVNKNGTKSTKTKTVPKKKGY